MSNAKPTLLVDKTIPFVQAYFSQQFDLLFFDAHHLTKDDLNQADALLIRSTLKINAELLDSIDTRIPIIATASSGYDHIDTAYLTSHNIQWRNAAGCNATSVAEYVISAIALALQKKMLPRHPTQPLTCGIIGVGHVGKRVQEYCEIIGMNVIVNDPFRAESDSAFSRLHGPLDTFNQCDIVTVHTPLTHAGPYPTYHLMNADFLNSLKSNCMIINAARGGILDTQYLANNRLKHFFILDTFPNEPNIDTNLLEQCFLATPHIAGHASEAKQRATQMCYQSLCTFFNLAQLDAQIAPAPRMVLDFKEQCVSWQDVVLRAYDPEGCQNLLKSHPDNFQTIRNQYSGRHEYSQYEVQRAGLTLADKHILVALGLEIKNN